MYFTIFSLILTFHLLLEHLPAKLMSFWHHMNRLTEVVSIYPSVRFPFHIHWVNYFPYLIQTQVFFVLASVKFLFSWCFHLETAEIADQFSNIQMRSSNSSADLPSSRIKQNSGEPLQWNPFEDSTPFDQMTEDHIYEAEFDALRARPTGMYFVSTRGKTIVSAINHNVISNYIFEMKSTASKAGEINSPPQNSGTTFLPQDLSSPVSQTSQTSSSSISLNGPIIGANAVHLQDEKDETSEDPFAGAPFSLPSGFRRASQKANRL